MYSNNTETLMTTEELIGLLNKNALGQLSANILPGAQYMGVLYHTGNDMAVYDGDAVAGNYYFKTSDGLVRVTANGTPTVIDQTRPTISPPTTTRHNLEKFSYRL